MFQFCGRTWSTTCCCKPFPVFFPGGFSTLPSFFFPLLRPFMQLPALCLRQVIEFDDGSGSVLRIQPLRTPRDEAIYECHASNSVGEITASTRLSVLRGQREEESKWILLFDSYRSKSGGVSCREAKLWSAEIRPESSAFHHIQHKYLQLRFLARQAEPLAGKCTAPLRALLALARVH